MGLERRVGRRGEQKRRADYVACVCGRRKSRKSAECAVCRDAFFRQREEEFLVARAAGMLNMEIAEQYAVSHHVVNQVFADMKARGVEVPVSPYFTRAGT